MGWGKPLDFRSKKKNVDNTLMLEKVQSGKGVEAL